MSVHLVRDGRCEPAVIEKLHPDGRATLYLYGPWPAINVRRPNTPRDQEGHRPGTWHEEDETCEEGRIPDPKTVRQMNKIAERIEREK